MTLIKNVLGQVQGWLGLPIHTLLLIVTQKGKGYDAGIHSCVTYQVVRLG